MKSPIIKCLQTIYNDLVYTSKLSSVFKNAMFSDSANNQYNKCHICCLFEIHST